MSWDKLKGNWQQLKGEVKTKWGKLTDDDMTYISGQRDKLCGKLREHYGYEKERAEQEIEDFLEQKSEKEENAAVSSKRR